MVMNIHSVTSNAIGFNVQLHRMFATEHPFKELRLHNHWSPCCRLNHSTTVGEPVQVSCTDQVLHLRAAWLIEQMRVFFRELSRTTDVIKSYVSVHISPPVQIGLTEWFFRLRSKFGIHTPADIKPRGGMSALTTDIKKPAARRANIGEECNYGLSIHRISSCSGCRPIPLFSL